MEQVQNTRLNCLPSTPFLNSFVLLLIQDYLEFFPSKQRQTDKDLFHFKPLLSGTVSLKLLDIPHLSSHSMSSLKTHLLGQYTENISYFCVVYRWKTAA